MDQCLTLLASYANSLVLSNPITAHHLHGCVRHADNGRRVLCFAAALLREVREMNEGH